MKELIDKALSAKSFAVVGASGNKSKFGNKILKRLMQRGYTVYPVNPNYDELEGVKCYHSLSEIEEKVDVVNVVVAPKYSLLAVDAAAEKGIETIWFQPGSFDDEVISKSLEKGLDTIYNHCVLVELG